MAPPSADTFDFDALLPMEARLVDALPAENGSHYEPKWDGFRCLAFSDGRSLGLPQPNSLGCSGDIEEIDGIGPLTRSR
jgi:hypothetical protein